MRFSRFLFVAMGALTSKTYTFRARPWELSDVITRDPFSNIFNVVRFNIRGSEILRVLPASNTSGWISNKTRFAYDGFTRQRLVMLSTVAGFVDVLEGKENYISAELSQPGSCFSGIVIGSTLCAEDFVRLSRFSSCINSDIISEFDYFENDHRFDFLCVDYKLSLVLFLDMDPKLYLPSLNLSFKKRASGSGETLTRFFSIGYISSVGYEVESLGSNLSTFFEIISGKHAFCKLVCEHKCLQIFYDPIRFGKYIKGVSSFVFEKFCIILTPITIHTGFVTQLEVGSSVISNFNSMSNCKQISSYSAFFADEFKIFSSDQTYFSLYFGSHASRNHYEKNLSLRPNLSFPLEASLEKNESFYDVFGNFGTTVAILSSTFKNVRALGHTLSFIQSLWLSSKMSYDNNFTYSQFKSCLKRVIESILFLTTVQNVKFSKITCLGYIYHMSAKGNQFVLVPYLFLRPSLDVYFFTDIITRSSKLMALSARRYYDKTNSYFI